MKKRVHIIVAGRVQGVFYRRYAQKRARQLGVTGWVRNLADGRVELVAEGPEERMEQFLHWARHGPTLAKVEKVQEEEQEPTGEFADFEVLETE